MPDNRTLQSPSVQVVSTTAYLIGVKEEMFNREFKTTVFQTMESKPEAKTIRTFCIMRNTLLRQNGMIATRFRNDPNTNIDKMPEYFPPELFSFLSEQGIEIITDSPKVNDYITKINNLINRRITACKDLYPMWVEWDYIKKLFQMPRGNTAILKIVDEYHASPNSYPYRCYINWPIHDPRAYSEDPESNDNSTTGNVLQNDKRFLPLLYYVNHDTFKDFHFVNDIAAGVQNDLQSFMNNARNIVLAVDCENSDPYKLCAVLKGIQEAALRSSDPDSFSKIQKIILFDDIHTVDTWGILKNYVSVPIEHIETERVNDHKSLVDIQMTAGVAKEHYVNNVDSILLASSDSDYWGLIKSLPTAHFMVLLEQDKYGEYLTEALKTNGIGYCIIDHFAGNIDDIKTGALDMGVREILSQRVDININDIVDELMAELRVELTDKQMEVYLKRLVKRLKIEVDDGTVHIIVKE